MSKLCLIATAFILTITAALPSYAANPCKPIAEACKQQGFYRGGDKSGKGLITNCVMPVASGEKVLPNTNFDANMLQQCKAMVMQKMQRKMQNS